MSRADLVFVTKDNSRKMVEEGAHIAAHERKKRESTGGSEIRITEET